MLFRTVLSVVVSCDLALAQTLWATHYDGTVSKLALTSSGLKVAQKQTTCGAQPSWLTYDNATKILYCLDEAYWGGSLSAFTIGSNGLSQIAKVNTLGNGVYSSLYGGDNGDSFLAIAHYSGNAFSTFKLPLTGSSTALQSFKYTMARPGPVPSRQDSPHPHEAAVDPTGNFMLVPDLGADLVRIYSINKSTGILTSCSNYTAKAGSGPRHVSFFVPGSAKRDVTGRRTRSAAVDGTVMYLGNEIANTISQLSVSYPSGGCLTLTEKKSLAPYPGGRTPTTAGVKVAEVQVKGLTLTTSNRADNSFGANNDSLALFSLSSSGDFTFQNIYPTYASYPRTMVINKAGDKVAIGNQNSASVTVVERNVTSGVFGRLLGSVVVGSTGSNGNGGLSSVIWEE